MWGAARASVRRDVTPNLFVAANTVNDTASVSAAVPLYWLENNRRSQPKLAGVGSFGIQRTQLIEPETSELTSDFIVGRIDAGINRLKSRARGGRNASGLPRLEAGAAVNAGVLCRA